MHKISHKSYTKILITLFLISLSLFIFSLFNFDKIENTISPVQTLNKEQKSNTPTPLTAKSIPGMEKTIEDAKTDSITLKVGELNIKLGILPGQTLYEILLAENNKKLVTFKGKEYTGMGFFVTDIGDLHEERSKYLMYYINGVEASEGISVYIPKSGDIVEWKLN